MKHNCFTLLTLSLFLNLVCTETQAKTTIPDSLLFREWSEDLLYHRIPPRTEGCDSIVYANGITYYYHSDFIFHLIATREFSEVVEQVWYYYYLMDICGPAIRQVERQKLLQAIKHYKSKALEQELDILDVFIHLHLPITPEKWNFAWELAKKNERQGYLQTKLRIMKRMLYACSGFPTNIVTERIEQDRVPVITLINEIFSTLNQLKGEPDLFEPGYFVRHIGLIYYNFKYYNKAIPLLWNAVEQPSGHYYNRNIMIARDYLGDYYTKIGDYDRSDSLYLSILKSPDTVIMRPVDDAIAIGAIAANANFRGNKDEAMRLYSIALPRALQVKDSTLAGGYALHLGRLFMENKEFNKTDELLQAARKYLLAGNLPIRNWERFYTLSRDYYLTLNRADMATAYIDSIAMISKEEEQLFNARTLAYAEQEAFEMEKALKEEQLRAQRTRLIFISTVFVLSLILLAILFYLYRKLYEKNRNLFLRIKAQESAEAKQEELWLHYNPIDQSSPSSENKESTQQTLFLKLREYLLTDRNFVKAEIDTNILISQLSTNRSYLFEAVKAATGKTLQEYINTIRLEEAKRLLESTDEVIESISEICGYTSVRTFYRLFRSHYNMSPATYRKIAKKQP